MQDVNLAQACSSAHANAPGAFNTGKTPNRRPDLDATTQSLTPAGRAFLLGRGLSDAVINANDIRSATRGFPEKNGWKNQDCIVFPFVKDDEVVNAKYRSLEGAIVAAFHFGFAARKKLDTSELLAILIID